MTPARAIAAAAALAASVSTLPASSTYQKILFKARDKVLPALVHIQPVLEIYRGGRQEKVAVTGSGFIFNAEGYVLTNSHVVENARRVTCTLYSRQEVEAAVIGSDPLSDLAVLRIEPGAVAGPLQPARLGDSDRLEVGEIVIALGSPLGLARSLSLGVVSSLNRYFPEEQLPSGVPTGKYNTWIQTDAAINPGNSGGPLVNLRGEVVGINARAIPVVGENLGFAIPINLAKEVTRKLIESGGISRSWIGVTWQDLQPLAGYLGVPGDRGAVVGSVGGGSPASDAGLQAGDVVVQFDDRPVSARFREDLPALEKMIADTPTGKIVDVIFLREGRYGLTQVVTRERPKVAARQVECREWGFTAQEITEDAVRAMKLADASGVLISGVRADSFAADAGLRHGDILRALESSQVADLDVFRDLCRSLSEKRTPRILAEVRRGRVAYYHLLKPTYRPEGAEAPGAPRPEADGP